VQSDRYFTTTTIWSLRQQDVVAECAGWIVFVDFATGKPADLVASGDLYSKLHALIVEKAEKAEIAKSHWEKDHPRKRPASNL
jgi:hypothetical protein